MAYILYKYSLFKWICHDKELFKNRVEKPYQK